MTPDLAKARERADRLAAALEHSGIGDWTWDRASDVLNVSTTAARLFSIAPGDHEGWDRMRGLIHPDDRARARRAAQDAIQGSADVYEAEYRVRGESGWRWVLSRARVDRTAGGHVRGLVGTVEDITRRKRAEEADRLLAQAGDAIAGSLDLKTTLTAIAGHLTQAFADGCSIDLVDDEGRIERVVLVTRDPEKAPLVAEMERRFPTPPDAQAGNVMAIRTGRPHLFPDITDEIIQAASQSAEHLELWRRIDMKSVISVPLIARGRTIGALTVVSHTEGSHYDEEDQALAVEIAHRAALAIDNARLHRTLELAAERMTRLQSLTAALSEAATVDQVATAVMRHGVVDLAANAGMLVALTPQGDEIEIIAATGYPVESDVGRGRRWPLEASIPIAEAVRSGGSVFVESLEALRQYDAQPLTSNQAWAAIPILRQGSPMGALLWAYAKPRQFTPADTGLMLSIASLAAQAIDRALLFEAERDARAAAELANGAKTRFLAMMSHELRTPLNAIVGYADLMVHGVGERLSPQQLGYVERIHGSATFLAQIIQEILAFSQLEAGREEIYEEDVDVCDVVRAATEMVRPMALAAKLSLDVQLPDSAVHLRTDRRKLTQVVLNLVSNAVKFTEQGGVTVTLEPGDAVRIRVVDTGVGIAPEALERVFEPFMQVDSSWTRRQGGTGLGLTVAARLARVLGGRIEAESEPGRGSTFTIVLPAAAADSSSTDRGGLPQSAR